MYSGAGNGNKPSSVSLTFCRNASSPTPYHAAFPVHHPPNIMRGRSANSPIPQNNFHNTAPLPPNPPKGPKPEMRNSTKIRSGRVSPHPRSMTVSSNSLLANSTFNPDIQIQKAFEIPAQRKNKSQHVLHPQNPPNQMPRSVPIQHTSPNSLHLTMQHRMWNAQNNNHHISQPKEHLNTRNHAQTVAERNITPTNSTTHTGPIPVAAVKTNRDQQISSSQNVRTCPLQCIGCNGYYNRYNMNEHYDEYQKQHLDHVIAYFENKLKSVQHDYTRQIKQITIANVNKIEELKHVNAKQIQELQQKNEELQGSIEELSERITIIAQRKPSSGTDLRKHTVHSRIPGHTSVRESKIPATFKQFQKVMSMKENVMSSDDSDSDLDLNMVIEEDEEDHTE